MPASQELPSESSPCSPGITPEGQPRGSGGEPKVHMYITTFVDWDKLIFMTHGQMNRRMDQWTNRLAGSNSDLDVQRGKM